MVPRNIPHATRARLAPPRQSKAAPPPLPCSPHPPLARKLAPRPAESPCLSRLHPATRGARSGSYSPIPEVPGRSSPPATWTAGHLERSTLSRLSSGTPWGSREGQIGRSPLLEGRQDPVGSTGRHSQDWPAGGPPRPKEQPPAGAPMNGTTWPHRRRLSRLAAEGQPTRRMGGVKAPLAYGRRLPRPVQSPSCKAPHAKSLMQNPSCKIPHCPPPPIWQRRADPGRGTFGSR